MQNIPFTLPRRKLFAYARACAELTLAYVLHGFLYTVVKKTFKKAYAELTRAYALHVLFYTCVNLSLRRAYAGLRFTWFLIFLCKFKLTRSLR